MKNTRTYGKQGELAAEKYLENNGYTILCRNYCIRGGEIDLIASKGEYLYFTEVKARRLDKGEKPAEAVDDTKRSHLLRTADAFLSEYRDNAYISALIPQLCIVEIYTDSRGNAVEYGLYTDML